MLFTCSLSASHNPNSFALQYGHDISEHLLPPCFDAHLSYSHLVSALACAMEISHTRPPSPSWTKASPDPWQHVQHAQV